MNLLLGGSDRFLPGRTDCDALLAKPGNDLACNLVLDPANAVIGSKEALGELEPVFGDPREDIRPDVVELNSKPLLDPVHFLVTDLLG